jgi:hypothetical protein
MMALPPVEFEGLTTGQGALARLSVGDMHDETPF